MMPCIARYSHQMGCILYSPSPAFSSVSVAARGSLRLDICLSTSLAMTGPMEATTLSVICFVSRAVMSATSLSEKA
jgi:hypothetical protein